MNNLNSLKNLHDTISKGPFSSIRLSGVETEIIIYDMGKSET